jgi:dTDP-4-amino-4,6-dideoxygalactose transaminase
MSEKIWLSSPHMGGTERKYIDIAFDENWIAPLGPNVNAFEQEIQNYLSIEHAAVLSSGTAAIHLGLMLMGVEAGDEVICQSFTFSATVNPVMYIGATPVFVDSEPETWNMSPEYLEEAIIDRIAKGRKPKAIIPVHLYGMPAKMDHISAIADKYGIPVLEDAAEALGSEYGKKKAGSFGKCSILSFNGNKIITTSGGGALISNDTALIAKARFLATQARDPAPHYQHSTVGYNYRMSNICAGIGLGQMEVLGKRVEQRRSNYQYYYDNLSMLTGISFQEEPGDLFFSNRWLTCIVINPAETGGINREDVRIALEKENIESRPLWKPMHLQPIFSDKPFYGAEVSAQLFENGLCLPSGSNLTVTHLEKICFIIKNVLSGKLSSK